MGGDAVAVDDKAVDSKKVDSDSKKDDATAATSSKKKHPSEFTAKDVAEFVKATFGDGERGIKLVKNFEEHEIDGELMVTLEKDDLTTDLGMTKLQARKFKMALDKLLAEPKSDEASAEKED